MTGPMLHILFSLSAAGTLHHALKKAGSGDEVIAFPDFLSYGPIDSLDPEDRLQALVREGLATFEEWDWLPPDLRAFWARCESHNRPRTLWVAPQRPDEMAGFLAYLDRFGDVPCDIVDLSEHEGGFRRPDGSPRGNCFGLGELDERDLMVLKDFVRPLRPDEVGPKRHLWEELVRENAMLRVPGGEGLVSVPETHLDGDILEACSAEWRETARVLGNVVGTLPDRRGYAVSDIFLEWRMERLVAQGVLETRPDETGRARRFASWNWIRTADAA